jgi:hypothetical protein
MSTVRIPVQTFDTPAASNGLSCMWGCVMIAEDVLANVLFAIVALTVVYWLLA